MDITGQDESEQDFEEPEAGPDGLETRGGEETGEIPAADPSALAGSLQQAQAELQQAYAIINEREREVAGLQEELGLAIDKYRDALLSSAQEVPQELVQGQTITEIEASMSEARQMVERIRNQLEAQTASQRVPAGAPARSGPDVSALSPQEKIAYALGRILG